MAKRDLSNPLNEVKFFCRPCRYTFVGVPERIEDAPEQDHHPFQYFSECPLCGTEVPQEPHERSLLKAWANATGPRTSEGKAASAKNLAGHPTPEEAFRTRFNAMKHGMSAQTATYFPARPGKYARCKTCEVSYDYCSTQPACIKQVELFMLHSASFEQKNPRHLTGIYANLQAGIFALLQEILQTIIGDGVKISNPAWAVDKDGHCVIATYEDDAGIKHTIHEIHAHPLFKPLSELLSRNNLSLSDMGMTMKDVEEQDMAAGRLESDEANRQTATEFMRLQSESMQALKGMLERSRDKVKNDPVLIEYTKQNGDG